MMKFKEKRNIENKLVEGYLREFKFGVNVDTSKINLPTVAQAASGNYVGALASAYKNNAINVNWGDGNNQNNTQNTTQNQTPKTSTTNQANNQKPDNYSQPSFSDTVNTISKAVSNAFSENRKPKTIIISEEAKLRLFTESAIMDKQRRKDAGLFRKTLATALENNTYQYDESTNTIYVDGYEYEIGKKFAETNEGDPIPLHYTLNSVMSLIKKYLGDEIDRPQSLNDEYEDELDSPYYRDIY